MKHLHSVLAAALGLTQLCAADESWLEALGNASHASALDWEAAGAKARGFVARLTLEEKLIMITGNSSNPSGCTGNIDPIPRVSFNGICLLDGPSTIGRNELVSVFPAGVTTAATWDRSLTYKRASALGEEFKAKGAHVALGPSFGALGRHALGGRNWEGFSPDPYLTGIAAGLTVQGLQSQGVQATSKHLIANEQETQRSNSTLKDGTPVNAISSNIDDRTLHEMYLWPFYDAVKAGTAAVMCSYNRLNQTYACENDALMEKILRKELGFRGYVMSDWYATHSAARAANAGLDLEMPGSTPDIPGRAPEPHFYGEMLAGAVANGSVPMDRLDEMVTRIMTAYYVLGQENPDFPTVDPSIQSLLAVTYYGLGPAKEALAASGIEYTEPIPRDVRADHASLIREIGAAGTVLLRNTGSLLPLGNLSNIGVFGEGAGDLVNGAMYPDLLVAPKAGTIAIGGGSGTGRFSYIVPPLEAIKAKARENNARVQYILNNTAIAENKIYMYPTPEVCLVFLTTFAAESYDRTTLEADGNSTQVVNNVADSCNSTVVILHGPGVVTMPWAEHPNVKAILTAHYPGQEVGNSIVDVLWGAQEPSGRLPYTLPYNDTDIGPAVVTNPIGSGVDDWQSDFTEGQFIDYRAFDVYNITPRYEFGFGLSYTTFELGNLTISSSSSKPSRIPDQGKSIQPGGNPDLWMQLLELKTSVRNTGAANGSAVPQLYITYPDSTPDGTPLRQLRGFEKLLLAPGESADVTFPLRRRDLSYWSVSEQNWVIPEGSFTMTTGFSSRNLISEVHVTVLE